MKKRLTSLVLVLVFAFAGKSAFAKSFEVGGGTLDAYASIRAFALYNNVDGGDVVGRDHSQFSIGMQSHSRVGAKWTQGDFHFNFEMGMGGAALPPPVTLRLLYGDYKFAGGNSGRIRVGQIPNISSTGSFYDRKLNGDDALLGFGTITEAIRRAGINYEIGDFSVSAISMRQDSSSFTALYNGYGNVEFTEIMPRIEAAYSVAGVFRAAGSFVQTSVKADNYATEQPRLNQRYNINAFHLALAAAPKIGDNMRIIASGFYSMNGGLYGMVTTAGGYDSISGVSFNRALPQLKEGTDKAEMENTTIVGGALAFRIDAFEAGLGYQSASNDAWKDNINGIGVYANYRVRLSSNFMIIPEFGYSNCGDRGSAPKSVESLPKDTRGVQAGVQFRIDI
ncbi:MAG: hypothetical protein LBJ21_06945 [Acidobacteriota bacterium]|nr:hypothetical protein [Acidobacteriota bacterium]